jgi:KDO2-lipid IV(A) lauroyltransferase
MDAVLGCLLAVVARIPLATLPWLGSMLGWFVGSVLRVRRDEVENAMKASAIARPAAQARAMYRSLGKSALEFIALSTPQADRIIGRVHVDDGSRRCVADALAIGRGLVIAGTHTGNWDLAACAMARTVDLLVVTKHLRVRPLDRFWQATRAAHGVLLCDAKGALTQARRVLARGGAVAMMIDQVPDAPSRAAVVDFLGRGAMTDRAPAVLAAGSRAPLMLVAGRRDTEGAHRLCVLGLWLPPARPSRSWIDETTRAATRALEEFVREHPSEWLWLHRRWKQLDARACEAMLSPPCATHSPFRQRARNTQFPQSRDHR